MIAEYYTRALSLAYGLAFAGGLLWLVIWRDGVQWRKIARAYPMTGEAPAERRWLQTVCLSDGGLAFNSYHGIITAGLRPDGVMLRMLVAPPGVYPPIFVPFSEMEFTERRWFLRKDAVWISTRQVPGISIVVFDKLRDRIREGAAGRPLPAKRARPVAATNWPN
ncbi:hypothetical protein [Hyphomonas sp.]|uniref:hypothetical protein n=1 Tax=Hyphomonas sp. TaxID=87 RepID=UPI0035274A41